MGALRESGEERNGCTSPGAFGAGVEVDLVYLGVEELNPQPASHHVVHMRACFIKLNHLTVPAHTHSLQRTRDQFRV